MAFFGIGKKEKKAKKEPKKEKQEPMETPKEGVRFTSIIELVGAPKKYVEETIRAYVDKIKQDSNYFVIKAEISPAKKIENKEDVGAKDVKAELFSTFVNLEIIAKKKSGIFNFCFNYMPSSIEVIEPMSVSFPANELSGFLTDIQGTLHRIDFTLKQTNAQNQILHKNMIQMLKNNMFLSLREKDKELSDLAKNVGIPDEQLKPFLDNMVKSGELIFEKNKYKIKK